MDRYNKYLIRTAQVISTVLHPWYMPLISIILLLELSYLSIMPGAMAFIMVAGVYFFTILLPHITVGVYRRVNGLSHHSMSERERRVVPYVLSIICYGALLVSMYAYRVPFIIMFVIASALLLQILCAIINRWYKISTHAAAWGAMVGMLFAFSLMLGVYMLGWICLAIIVTGVVGTARMILRQHTLSEIAIGTLVGLLSGWTSMIYMYEIGMLC